MSQKSEHHYQRLIQVFKRCFKEDYNTLLVAGEDEPYYQPATQDGEYNQVVFAHGFFASALHETAHWCIAGEARRKQFDYGYWYEPDGRNEAQQKRAVTFAKALCREFNCSWPNRQKVRIHY